MKKCEALNCEDESKFCVLDFWDRSVGCDNGEFPECRDTCPDTSFSDDYRDFYDDCRTPDKCWIKTEEVQAPSESDSSQTEEDKYKAQEGFSLFFTTYRDKLKDFKE